MGTRYLLDTNVIINNFTLITHNIKDFQKIKELQVIDSYKI